MAHRHADWLRQAAADLRHARNALEDADHGWACFAAQQAAEARTALEDAERVLGSAVARWAEPGRVAEAVSAGAPVGAPPGRALPSRP